MAIPGWRMCFWGARRNESCAMRIAPCSWCANCRDTVGAAVGLNPEAEHPIKGYEKQCQRKTSRAEGNEAGAVQVSHCSAQDSTKTPEANPGANRFFSRLKPGIGLRGLLRQTIPVSPDPNSRRRSLPHRLPARTEVV